ncbi:uncharacterized protein CPUR_04018 [Claviceps purpurea 20.1]|uniref:Uncharacterized protein n=1 Tax=Claviceps purpurea (strain 20.1) TaxID=1111077 RepID=M1W5X1_CLAP2|nr:uncharacterized protein CPUR_04018 [Claviceps purpurea 20.1]
MARFRPSLVSEEVVGNDLATRQTTKPQSQPVFKLQTSLNGLQPRSRRREVIPWLHAAVRAAAEPLNRFSGSELTGFESYELDTANPSPRRPPKRSPRRRLLTIWGRRSRGTTNLEETEEHYRRPRRRQRRDSMVIPNTYEDYRLAGSSLQATTTNIEAGKVD